MNKKKNVCHVVNKQMKYSRCKGNWWNIIWQCCVLRFCHIFWHLTSKVHGFKISIKCWTRCGYWKYTLNWDVLVWYSGWQTCPVKDYLRKTTNTARRTISLWLIQKAIYKNWNKITCTYIYGLLILDSCFFANAWTIWRTCS